MRVMNGKRVLLLAAGLFAVLGVGEPLKFPDSSSSGSNSADTVAAGLTGGEPAGGSRDATRAIEEILSAARAGRNVGITIGDQDLDSLATDPELKRTLETPESSRSDVQARNYISNKLCSLGLAKCGEARHYGGGGSGDLNNIRDVTLVQPVSIKPIGQPIAAIPLGSSNRPYNPSGGGSYPSNLYPSETQGGAIHTSDQRGCTCVRTEQCNSYDIVSGPGGSSSYPSGSSSYPSGSSFPSGGSYPSNYPDNSGNHHHNQNNYPGFGGRPSYGQVGHGIDPRNKFDSGIESNATVVEASEIQGRSLPESGDDSKNKTRVTRDAPRVVTGGFGGCYDRQVCCRNPIYNNPSSYPSGSSYPPSYPSSQNNFPSNNQYPSQQQQQQHRGSCGRRNAYGINGRVLTGVQSNYGIGNGDTEFGEYPWQVAILRKEGADNVFVCGGSLIDSRHVLTAAHCIQSLRPQLLRVRLGDWDVGGETEFYRHQDLNVAAVALHPDFNSGNLFNDIAIVKLDGYVDPKGFPHISPICLPDKYFDFTGKRCIVTGWGKDAWGHEGKFQHRLKEVDLPVLNHYDCEQKLKRTKLGSNFVLHPGFICAGGEPNRDACKGDGGGPLACEVGGVWQLTGIISWGVGCGQPDVPGVYVKVSNYHDWIRQNIGF